MNEFALTFSVVFLALLVAWGIGYLQGQRARARRGQPAVLNHYCWPQSRRTKERPL